MPRAKRTPVENHPGVYSYRLTSGAKRYGVRFRDQDNKSTDKPGFERLTDAVRFQRSVAVKVDAGEYIPSRRSAIAFGELAEAFFTATAISRNETWTAIKECRWRLHIEPVFAHLPVRDITDLKIQGWVNDLRLIKGYSPSYVISLAGDVKQVLGYGIKKGVIRDNPFDDVSLPRRATVRQRRYLTHEEIREAAGSLPSERGEELRFLAYTGLRWGEFTAIQKKQFDLGQQRMTINRAATRVHKPGGGWRVGLPKFDKIRTVPLVDELIDIIESRLEGLGSDDLVFPSFGRSEFRDAPTRPGTRRPNPNQHWLWIGSQAAGLPELSAHDLRHTFASLSVQAGANVKALQRLLGHEKASMTLDIYADLFVEDLDEVARRLGGAAQTARAAALAKESPTGRPRLTLVGR